MKWRQLTKTYDTWRLMVSRCVNSSDSSYKNYGGRGINVCNRWLEFENFIYDMRVAPEGMTLERVDNNGSYEPGNCKWASILEQANNKRTNVNLEYKGETRTVSEWSRLKNISPFLIYRRLENGWSIDRAINESPNVKHAPKKLSDIERSQIRFMCEEKIPRKEVAKQLGVSKATVDKYAKDINRV